MHKFLIPAAALTTLLCTPPLHAGDEKRSLMAENEQARAFQEQVGYAEAVLADDFVFLSGVVAGPAPGETDLKPGYDRAFRAIGRSLKRAGTSWANVVDITTFHTDLRNHIDDFAEVKNRYVKAPFPAWTAIGTTELYSPSAVVEIKVIALLPDDDEAETAEEKEDATEK